METKHIDEQEQLKAWGAVTSVAIPVNDTMTARLDGFQGKELMAIDRAKLNRLIFFYRLLDRLDGFFSDNMEKDTCPPFSLDWEKVAGEDVPDVAREAIKQAFRYGYYAAMQDCGECWGGQVVGKDVVYPLGMKGGKE